MRCNVGVDPKLLSDQHLRAEYYELAMIPGQLRKHKFVIKGPVKPYFGLGFAHMNFFKDKLMYLQKRKKVLVEEMRIRGFTVNFPFLDIRDIPKQFWNDWTPTIVDSQIIRARIEERLLLKPDWYKYLRQDIGAANMNNFIDKMYASPCYFV